MKKFITIVILLMALHWLAADAVAESITEEEVVTENDKSETTEDAWLGIAISTKVDRVFWGVVNSSLSTSKAGENSFQSANGFQIGMSNTYDFLKIKGKRLLETESGYKYTQRNYKVDHDEVVSRGYLDFFYNIRYEIADIHPYVGFGTSWLLTGQKPNKTWVNDIPLNVGVEIGGFKYEYSHGTYTAKITPDHRAKTNTHTISWVLHF